MGTNSQSFNLLPCSNTLNDFINAVKIVSNSIGGVDYVLDSTQRIAMVSNGFCEYFSIPNPNDLVYRRLEELELPFFYAYKRFKLVVEEQYLAIKSERMPRIYLEVFGNSEGKKTLFSTRKTPIFSTKDEFIGIHVQMRLFSVARLANLGSRLFNIKGFPTNRSDFKIASLTRKQQMVLYLYARNYSYTEVSTWLSALGHKMSPSRVNEHLENLKKALNAPSKDSLRDMSLKLGYDVAVPAEFLPEGIHDITDDVFDLWIC